MKVDEGGNQAEELVPLLPEMVYVRYVEVREIEDVGLEVENLGVTASVVVFPMLPGEGSVPSQEEAERPGGTDPDVGPEEGCRDVLSSRPTDGLSAQHTCDLGWRMQVKDNLRSSSLRRA
jgi:hypothetical protein